ncbi:restriction modification system DNA specificity domain protein [Methanococcus maripaludis X1]|uniref:Restriction modification system DNA specificity domain protein n=1 Tax=Methanococcus maripaludis X1 TaxID=1053692 RepID=G0GZN3_METMI|nr:restriction endonuclease subunit S [Methanococcus maripaludis]AEK19764.1 restriction modification system DNA specificity domain protein [Methanococcus maripaludis X1]
MENEFKDTEIGKIPVDWEVATFSEIIDINPKRTLKKGEKYKKIAMTDIKEYTRKIQSYSDEEYKGGSRFTNEDTLFARITPCLENGKTAFVDILNENEIAFGSTEFIVLCGKKGITDSKYVYYLSISPEIRKKTIKSMIGTSGRQRVPNEIFESIEIPLPPLEEQQKIAQILSALDDKIENNNLQNKILEETADSIFKEWFVNFNFLDENGLQYFENGGEMEFNEELGIEIPKGWKVGKLGDLSNLMMGLSPKGESYNENKEGIPLLNGAADFNGKLINPTKYTTQPTRICQKNDLIFCIRGTIGNITFADLKYCLGRGVAALTPKKEIYKYIIYQNLEKSIENMTKQAAGSVIKGLSKNDISDLKITIANDEIFLKYHKTVKEIFEKISKNNSENQNLSNLRDLLLPKLMSGEIRLK